jgi:hypothetical protein
MFRAVARRTTLSFGRYAQGSVMTNAGVLGLLMILAAIDGTTYAVSDVKLTFEAGEDGYFRASAAVSRSTGRSCRSSSPA